MGALVSFDLPASVLAGKVVVVTGASRGLGAGLASRFSELGMRLGLCARSVPDASADASALCRSVDVADSSAMDAFCAEVVESFGPIDLWVNNAGVLEPMGPQRDHDPAEADRALLVNVGGVMNGTRSFTRAARTWPDARRVLANVTSGAARSVYEGWSVYGATKAAVNHFTEIVDAEEPSITCHAVAPGVVDTDMQARIRTHDETTFPAIDRFRQLNADGAWNSSAWVADHLAGLVAGTFQPDQVVVRIPNEPR